MEAFWQFFLMLMIPNVSAVEYNQVEETRESFVKNKIDNLENKIKKIDKNDLGVFFNTSFLQLDNVKIRENLEEFPLLKDSFQNYFF